MSPRKNALFAAWLLYTECTHCFSVVENSSASRTFEKLLLADVKLAYVVEE
jgi:hypothetical protein